MSEIFSEETEEGDSLKTEFDGTRVYEDWLKSGIEIVRSNDLKGRIIRHGTNYTVLELLNFLRNKNNSK